MARSRVDLTGQRFGILTAIEPTEGRDFASIIWKCKCDCGNYKLASVAQLRSGNYKSCGCLHVKHGLYKHPLFTVWYDIKRRCYDESRYCYKNYGGRGITMCDEWRDDFKSFYDWAMTHGYNEGLTIDRINNDGNYEPGNCRWATMKSQCNNRRSNKYLTYNNRTQTIAEWADEYGLNQHTLYSRINSYGWSIEKALITPVRKE